ncbi:MAG: hypothetical protein ACOC0P_01010 [Planctomycetota bacterium]
MTDSGNMETALARRGTAASLNLAAILLGLTIGLASSVAVYWWQRTTEISVATCIIMGYTAAIWLRLRAGSQGSVQLKRHLRTLPVNDTPRRLRRLFSDGEFWSALGFGVVLIGGAAWHGGLRDPMTLSAILSAWVLITIVLDYDLTLLEPTTRCRRCQYQLASHMDVDDPDQIVQCPECGAAWTKRDLCLVQYV